MTNLILTFEPTVILLFAVLAFSNCEEDGAIQFVVKDSFPTPIPVKGLEGQSSYTSNNVADISGLIENGTKFVEADIETVAIKLQDYSGTSIIGNMKLTTNGIVLLDKDLTLTTTDQTITVPVGASGILDAINTGTLTIALEGTTATPIEDNDFTIVVTPTVRGTVE